VVKALKPVCAASLPIASGTYLPPTKSASNPRRDGVLSARSTPRSGGAVLPTPMRRRAGDAEALADCLPHRGEFSYVVPLSEDIDLK
jgi:hypothetical protein